MTRTKNAEPVVRIQQRVVFLCHWIHRGVSKTGAPFLVAHEYRAGGVHRLVGHGPSTYYEGAWVTYETQAVLLCEGRRYLGQTEFYGHERVFEVRELERAVRQSIRAVPR